MSGTGKCLLMVHGKGQDIRVVLDKRFVAITLVGINVQDRNAPSSVELLIIWSVISDTLLKLMFTLVAVVVPKPANAETSRLSRIRLSSSANVSPMLMIGELKPCHTGSSRLN